MLYTTTYSYATDHSNHIIAIVNDDVISQFDVENRLDFLIRKFHLSQTPAVRRHLLPQILQNLVDEHLKVQIAKSLSINLSNSEVSRAISSLVDQQNPLLNRQSLSALTDLTAFSLLATDSGLTGPLRTPDLAPMGALLAPDSGLTVHLRTPDAVPLSAPMSSLLASGSGLIGPLHTPDSASLSAPMGSLLASGSGLTGPLHTPDSAPLSAPMGSLLASGSGLTGPLRTPGYVTESFFLAQDPLQDHLNNYQERGLFKDHLFIDILINEIRSEIAWHKIVQHTVHLKIEESEINTALKALHKTENQIQNLLAEIVLQVSDSADGEDIRVLAEQIVGQVRTGADFKAAARQFSQAASATHGGDLGWILQGQLEFAIENVLQKMQPGQFSMPIRTFSGYTIVLLRERRTACSADNTLLTLRQLFMPLTGPESLSPHKRSDVLAAARMTSSCEAFDALIQQTGTPQSGRIGQIRAGDLLPTLRAVVLRLSPQTASVPLPMNGGLAILMVCDRKSPAQQLDLSSREVIAQQLERAKIENIYYERLQNLRRAAFIEVRPQ